MKRLLIFSLSVIFILSWRCEIITDPGFENPYDSTATEHIPPQTTIIAGPEDNEVINNHTVTFQWTGNETAKAYFYSLDNQACDDWTSDTTATFELLDEGEHLFSVVSKTPAGEIEDNPPLRQFQIDAVQGPALRFFPRKVRVATNETFIVEVVVEEVTDLMGLYVELPLNPDGLELIDREIYLGTSDFLSKESQNILTVDVEDLTNNLLKITLGRVSDINAGVSGTGKIIQLTYRLTGNQNTLLSFTPNCAMENSQIQSIEILERVDCVIEVGE